MKADDIIEALIWRFHGGAYARLRDWIVCREFRMGSGFLTSDRRIDLWAISVSPSKGNPAISYEVKVSRSDFLRDIKDPEKHRHARLFSDRFYFAAPLGLLKAEEIPDWAGLIEISEVVDEEGRRESGTYDWVAINVDRTQFRRVKIARDAPLLSKHAPSWPLVISLLRRVPALAADEVLIG